jgi:hypothetical protein
MLSKRGIRRKQKLSINKEHHLVIAAVENYMKKEKFIFILINIP